MRRQFAAQLANQVAGKGAASERPVVESSDWPCPPPPSRQSATQGLGWQLEGHAKIANQAVHCETMCHSTETCPLAVQEGRRAELRR